MNLFNIDYSFSSLQAIFLQNLRLYQYAIISSDLKSDVHQILGS